MNSDAWVQISDALKSSAVAATEPKSEHRKTASGC